MVNDNIAKRLIIAPIETDYSKDDVKREIEAGIASNVRGVIVSHYFIDFAKSLMKDTATRLGTLCSYPLGAMTTNTKVELIKNAVEKGLDEIDVALDYNAIKSGDFSTAKKDLEQIMAAADGKLDIVAIPLVAQLTFDELEKTCNMFIDVGVERIKTNSGMGLGSTKLEHVKFIRRIFRNQFAIEVSGGVRTREQAETFIDAGADCIHSSTWQNLIE